METIFWGIVIFLIVLAVFDLVVGVSNDAVNFINSAIGSKAASFRIVIFTAAIGVFAGVSAALGHFAPFGARRIKIPVGGMMII